MKMTHHRKHSTYHRPLKTIILLTFLVGDPILYRHSPLLLLPSSSLGKNEVMVGGSAQLTFRFDVIAVYV